MSEARRDATQALIISMTTQFELIKALVTHGAITAEAALPIVARIGLVIGVWGKGHEDLTGDGALAREIAAYRDILESRRAS